MNAIIAALTILTSIPAQDAKPETDLAFQMAKKLAGGVWETKIGDADARLEFTLAQGGQMLVGKGTVSSKGKVLLNMDSRFGWDPIEKKPYYIDFHNHDTVYYGHLSVSGSELWIDFGTLVGSKGEWRDITVFHGNDAFTGTLMDRQGSKVGNLVHSSEWKRRK